jgi:hypothetical protein
VIEKIRRSAFKPLSVSSKISFAVGVDHELGYYIELSEPVPLDVREPFRPAWSVKITVGEMIELSNLMFQEISRMAQLWGNLRRKNYENGCI